MAVSTDVSVVSAIAAAAHDRTAAAIPVLPQYAGRPPHCRRSREQYFSACAQGAFDQGGNVFDGFHERTVFNRAAVHDIAREFKVTSDALKERWSCAFLCQIL